MSTIARLTATIGLAFAMFVSLPSAAAVPALDRPAPCKAEPCQPPICLHGDRCPSIKPPAA